MYGIRLTRIANTWSAANSKRTAAAAHQRTDVRHRAHTVKPIIAAIPITTVIAISVGENRPDTMRAHPSRNNQMNTVIASQKAMHAKAAHFAVSFR